MSYTDTKKGKRIPASTLPFNIAAWHVLDFASAKNDFFAEATIYF
jgi:hypothetical protein